jgi:hypothetical protein
MVVRKNYLFFWMGLCPKFGYKNLPEKFFLADWSFYKNGPWHSSFCRTSKHCVSCVNTSTTELEKLACSVFLWNCNQRDGLAQGPILRSQFTTPVANALLFCLTPDVMLKPVFVFTWWCSTPKLHLHFLISYGHMYTFDWTARKIHVLPSSSIRLHWVCMFQGFVG